MTRVLHLLSRFDIGGTERQLVERLRRHPRGFEPRVACCELYGKFLPPIRALGIEPFVIPLEGLAHPSAALAVAQLARLIRKEKVELVHANDFAMAAVGLPAARLAGARFIVNRVDLGHRRPGFGSGHRMIEAFTARRADLVCANAEAVRQVCVEEEGCDPSRVAVVRNGMDLAAFDALASRPCDALPVEPGDVLVAVIGNLWPVKGHRTLLEAAVRFRGRVKFLCAGEGVEKPFLVSRIRELGLEKTVLLIGHRTDVPALLARSHAFALCSSAEGLSNAIMEAMAARLPIVATRVGGNPELLADGRGLLVPHGDPAALAEALKRILVDRAGARELGRRARAFVEAELSPDRMQAAHEELYRRALDAGEQRSPRVSEEANAVHRHGREPCSTS
jgi:glycosyltransferase involved in cell wall biosynthesis